MCSRSNIHVDIDYVAGEHQEAGWEALAEAMLALSFDATILDALRVARDLAQTTFRQRAQQRILAHHAASLRSQLTTIEEQMRDAA